MTNFKTGIDMKLSAAQYHADPCEVPSLTQSIALVLNEQTPAHAFARHPKLGGKSQTPTPAMISGSLIDSIVYGTYAEDSDEYQLIEAADYRTKDAREKRDAALAAGRRPLLTHQLDEAFAAAEAVKARYAAAGIDIAAGAVQVPVFWTDAADDGTVVQCRALLDQLEQHTIRDLKTCESANPRDLPKHCERYGYDIQAAAYQSGMAACFPSAAGRFRFEWTFIEKDAPFAFVHAEPDGSMLQLGRARWRRAINIWARCMNTGEWPATFQNGEGMIRLGATQWKLQEMQLEDAIG